MTQNKSIKVDDSIVVIIIGGIYVFDDEKDDSFPLFESLPF